LTDSPTAPYLSVVVPAYDEEARLPRTLERLREYYDAQHYSYDVTVVSDGSKDGTVQIATSFSQKHSQFSVIDSQPNHGKGFVVRHGILAARGEVILFCDADLATPQEETEKLLPKIQSGFDVAIGSRPLRESNLEVRQPIYREALGRVSNGIIQLLAVPGIRDTQCGFKMFRREAALDIFSRCKLDGFSFDFEALMIARDLGYRISEVPIRWMHQDGSKVSFWRDYPRTFRDLIRLRLMGKDRRLTKLP
jgi:dolichyl-phosphate beta-glucosyltransferase